MRTTTDMALRDHLTGLLNRSAIFDVLSKVQNNCADKGCHQIVAKFDIDGFSQFNDAHGHAAGDELLCKIALRLETEEFRGLVAGRTGSDDLTVVFPQDWKGEETNQAAAEDAVRCLIRFLERPVQLRGLDWSGTFSFGVTVVGPADIDLDDVLRRLEIGLKQAKKSSCCAIARLATHRVSQLTLTEDTLKLALQRQEYMLYYQPQHDMAGEVASVEALLRWRLSCGTIVSPGSFIPFCESTGFIVPLGLEVMKMACTQLAQWQHLPEMSSQRIAVNVSPRQLLEPSFARDVRSIIRSSGADPGRLTLELTESQPIAEVEYARAAIFALFDEGVRFALDDFGTGYASLTSVSRLPLAELKIDRSFVCEIGTCARSAGIVNNMLALARHLGLCVTAEGVETAAQRDILANSGCDKFQGYLFSPPLPLDEIMDYVSTHSSALGQHSYS